MLTPGDIFTDILLTFDVHVTFVVRCNSRRYGLGRTTHLADETNNFNRSITKVYESAAVRATIRWKLPIFHPPPRSP